MRLHGRYNASLVVYTHRWLLYPSLAGIRIPGLLYESLVVMRLHDRYYASLVVIRILGVIRIPGCNTHPWPLLPIPGRYTPP